MPRKSKYASRIISKYRAGKSMAQIARELDVYPSLVYQILKVRGLLRGKRGKGKIVVGKRRRKGKRKGRRKVGRKGRRMRRAGRPIHVPMVVKIGDGVAVEPSGVKTPREAIRPKRRRRKGRGAKGHKKNCMCAVCINIRKGKRVVIKESVKGRRRKGRRRKGRRKGRRKRRGRKKGKINTARVNFLRSKGMTAEQIAKIMGRSVASITSIIKLHQGRGYRGKRKKKLKTKRRMKKEPSMEIPPAVFDPERPS